MLLITLHLSFIKADWLPNVRRELVPAFAAICATISAVFETFSASSNDHFTFELVDGVMSSPSDVPDD